MAERISPGGARAVVAESVLVKHQLLILNRSRRRAPTLHLADRMVAGVCTLFISPSPDFLEQEIRCALKRFFRDLGRVILMAGYRSYYERSRTHLSLDKDTPIPRLVTPPGDGAIVAIPEVGGLHHRYEQRAA